MSYQKENDEFLHDFLENSFFRGWKHHEEAFENFSRIELTFAPDCNLDCKYCYYAQYGDELWPLEVRSVQSQRKNLATILDFLIDNEYTPEIEFFSGEPLVTKFGLECLDTILTRFANVEKKPKAIVIPTNFTFLLHDDKIEEVERLLMKSNEVGIRTFLSASFDGKYMEQNRPFKYGPEVRDDAYYDKCFAFAKKWNCGFHPMVYSDGIEFWKENFLWFQAKLKEYELPFDGMYLLEVRDKEWTTKQLEVYGQFIEFLVEWASEHLGDTDKLVDFILQRGFNILKSAITTVGRGIGCSVQSVLFVRMGDLAIIPCHRTSYPAFNYGRFVVEDDKITGVEAGNIALMNTLLSFKTVAQPYCEKCNIKYLCNGGCLGSQFETNGELFTPIPTVCAMYKQKMISLARAYSKVGAYDKLTRLIQPEKKAALDRIKGGPQ